MLTSEFAMISDFYGRKSTRDDGRSAARQERDWAADCTREGFQQGRRFIDPDLSASQYATKPRPDYLALVEHIKSGNCRMVSMWEASRGSRELEEWIVFLKLCKAKSVLIRIFGGGDPRTFDVRNRRDWRTLVEEGVDAHDESDKLSERIRDGVRDGALEGRPYGRLPYGYSREYGLIDGKLRPTRQFENETQAAVIRGMVEATLAGKSMHAQAQALNDEGVPTSSGRGEWKGHVIRRILLNPVYTGRRLHRGEQTAEECWPPIITDEEHRRLVAKLAVPGRRISSEATLKYQLTAAASCGLCGGVIRTTGAKAADRAAGQPSTRYRCAACHRVSVRCSDVDRLINFVMRARLRSPDTWPAFTPARDDAAARAAKAEIDALGERLAEAKRVWKAGDISAASFGEYERDLAPQIEAAQRRYQKVTTPTALQGMNPLEIADRWPDLPPGMRRTVIVGLAEVYIFPIGQGNGWTPWRLAESRWRGEELTWGQIWTQSGEPPA